jgi:hypothetical protein
MYLYNVALPMPRIFAKPVAVISPYLPFEAEDKTFSMKFRLNKYRILDDIEFRRYHLHKNYRKVFV